MKKKLVVLGSGFGAFSFLKNIKDFYEIIVISPRNHFVFTPLLASTTVGTLEFRSIIEPIRNLKHTTFYQAVCLNIDNVNNNIICFDYDSESEFQINFDYLLIAVGEVTRTYNIPGVKEFSYFLREVTDARKIRVKVIDCFENASLPEISEEQKKKYTTFIVCGGGPTGVEFAAELFDFIEEDIADKYPALAKTTEVILIEALDKILGSFDEKLSEYTAKLFKRQHINLKTNTQIKEVLEDKIILKSNDVIPYGILVWATGNEATELIKNSAFKKTKNNKIITNNNFKVKGSENIYAIGDCSQIEHESYPATAQTAQQEGKYLANYFNKISRNKRTEPFKYKSFGMLAYVGDQKALADTPNFKGSGFGAYIFWRSVYFTKLVSLKNKILVLFDWFKTFVFGRDSSNF